MSRTPTANQVVRVLEAAMRVPLDSLEQLVQEAHESTPKQMDDPPQLLPVTRQALRMFWHFRCNLDAVDVFTEGVMHD